MCYRHFMAVCFLVLAALTIANPAQAQEGAKATVAAETAVSSPEPAASSPQAQPTRIDVNEQDGTVKIIIGGREVMRIDDKGVFVDGSIKSTESLKTNVDEAAALATGEGAP